MAAAVLPIAGDPYGSWMRARGPAATIPYPAAVIVAPVSADPDKIRAGGNADYFVPHGWRTFIDDDLTTGWIRMHDAAGHGGQGSERCQDE